MAQRVGQLIVLAVIVVAIHAPMPAAHACSDEGEFSVTIDHLFSRDLNESDSALAREALEEYPNRPVPQILGVSMFETIHSVQPGEGWSRGSVSVITQAWGAVPATNAPLFVDAVDITDVVRDSCGNPQDGRTEGSRWFRLTTSEAGEGYSFVYQSDAQAIQTAAQVFGDSFFVERDSAAEARMIAALDQRVVQAERATTGYAAAITEGAEPGADDSNIADGGAESAAVDGADEVQGVTEVEGAGEVDGADEVEGVTEVAASSTAGLLSAGEESSALVPLGAATLTVAAGVVGTWRWRSRRRAG